MSFNDPIDVELIQQHLPENHNCFFQHAVTSTQSEVKPNSLLIVEHQTAGMGRRGKQWLTPAGRAICLSYRFELSAPAAQMSGYQITTALAITQAINHFESKAEVQLKWPNDLYHHGQKFAGILINLTPRQMCTEVIVGIGINWQLSTEQLESVNQPVCNVPFSSTTFQQLSRSQFIAKLIQLIENNNQTFTQLGLSGFISQWQQHDYLANKTVEVNAESLCQTGEYMGLNRQGELMVRTQHGIKTFCSGEVSVKAV